MKRILIRPSIVPCGLLAFTLAFITLPSVPVTAAPSGTAFSYQGRLDDGGVSANGRYDFQFTLHGAVSGGGQIGSTFITNNVAVSNGIFAVALDFGAVFEGSERWLEIGVRTNGASAFVTLSPRQSMLPVPYALYAPDAGTAASSLAANLIGNIADAQLSTNVALLSGDAAFRGTVQAAAFAGSGAALTGLNVESIGPPGSLGLYWLGFTARITNAVGASPQAVVAADMNADGWVDLVSANAGANSLTVLTNNHHGSFAVSGSPGVGLSPYSVVAVDVNGDGWTDVASANYDANSLSVLTNNHGVGLIAAATLNVGGVPHCVTAADVNRDGWMDLISANSGVNTLTILTNNRSGGFAEAQSPLVGFLPYGLTAGDVNGDGWMDLISTDTGTGKLTVLTNNRAGRFFAAASPTVGAWPVAVIAADLNQDGWLELISADYDSSTLTVLINNRAGGFGLSSTMNVGYAPDFVAAADLDHDGWLDLVTSDYGDHTLTVLTNNRHGGCAHAATLSPAYGTRGVVAADLNGDDWVDLVSADQNIQSLTVFLNSGGLAANVVMIPGNVGLGTAPTGNRLEVAGTISASSIRGNGSGLTSLAAGNVIGTLTSAQLSTGNLLGTLADTHLSTNVALLNRSQTFSSPNRFSHAGNSFVGNFTGNGAALTNLEYGSMNLGGVLSVSNAYDSVTNVPVAGDLRIAVSADFNNDGHPDVACAGGTRITILTNRGHGTLQQSWYETDGGRDLATADFDGDGNADLVWADYAGNRLELRFGDGAGGILRNDGIIVTNPIAVAVLDANQDGWPDVVGAQAGSGALRVYGNDGTGEFHLVATPDTDGGVRMLLPVDLNADGWPDLITGASADDLAALTNSHGVFTSASPRAISPFDGRGAVVDLNRDGYPDLVAVDQAHDRIIVFHNQSGARVIAVSTNTLHSSDGPDVLAVADFTGDNWPDLAVGSSWDDNVEIFVNDHTGRLAWQRTLTGSDPHSLVSLLAPDLDDDTQPDLVKVEDTGLLVLLSESMVRFSGANFGLGRFPAANRLEVEGDASKTTAGGWLANSDRRIKHDVAAVTNALETLDRVRLVSFRYTDEYRAAHPGVADRRYLNVVAQEFQEVFPDAVKLSGERAPGNGAAILQVDTHPLLIYSAAAVQELNRKLDARCREAEARNQKTETDLRRLKAENAKLRQTLGELERLMKAMSERLSSSPP